MQNKGELTTKALLLLKTFLECGCDKKKTARRLNKSYTSVYQQLHQPYVRNIFKMVCLEKGITFDRLAKVIDEGLNATKVIGYLNNKVDGVEKISDEFMEVPDHPTRHKFVNTALEVFDVLKYNVKVEANQGPQFHFYNIKQIIEDANRDRTDSIKDASPASTAGLGARPA